MPDGAIFVERIPNENGAVVYRAWVRDCHEDRFDTAPYHLIISGQRYTLLQGSVAHDYIFREYPYLIHNEEKMLTETEVAAYETGVPVKANARSASMLPYHQDIKDAAKLIIRICAEPQRWVCEYRGERMGVTVWKYRGMTYTIIMPDEIIKREWHS